MHKIIYFLTILVLTATQLTMAQPIPADTLPPATRSDTLYLAPTWQKTGLPQVPVSFSASASSLTTCLSQPVTVSLTIPERSLGSMLIFSVPQGDSIRSSLLSVPDRNGQFLLTTEATKPGQYSFSFILLTADTTITRSITIEATPCSLSLIAPDYNCQTGAFTFRHMGGDTSAVTYMAIGITSWDTRPDVYTVTPDCDTQPFTLMARNNSNPTAITTYTWNYTLVCPENCKPEPVPVPPSTTTVAPVSNPCASPDSTLGQPLQLLPPDYDCQSGGIKFRVSGGSGGQLSFMSPNITGWTTNCQTNIQSFVLIADIRNPDIPVEPFMLFVKEEKEDGTLEMAQLRWDPKGSCADAAARKAIAEQPLTVMIAGNPVSGNAVEVLIDGLQQEPVQLRVISLQGQTVSEQSFAAPPGPIRTVVKTGQSSGIYLIQATTPTRRKSVRLVKQ